jgi:hypothetical protein
MKFTESAAHLDERLKSGRFVQHEDDCPTCRAIREMPISALPDDFMARIAKLKEWVEKGYIDQDTANRLSIMP